MFLQDRGGEIAGRFDKLSVIQKDKGLGRAVGAAAFDATDFERGLVEDDHVVLRFGATPVAVKRTAMNMIEISFSIVDRVVGFHRRATTFVAEETGSEKGGVADGFAGKTVGGAAGEKLVGNVA